MIPELRRAFNAGYTEGKYQRFLERLDAGCGTSVEFRNSETPCFFPNSLLTQLATYGEELIQQLMGSPDYLAAAERTVPDAYRVPTRQTGEDTRPLFVQVDFGLDREGQPKLVEIQGFPSLYAYQPFLAQTYRDAYGLDPNLRSFLGDLSDESYLALLRRAIVADHAPENVVLLEIEPQKQKTLCDFLLTERLLGVRAVCLTAVEFEKEGNKLFYRHEGRRIPIERIYNRVIVEELMRKGIVPPFDLRDELDVTWAGHPNWYFKISKFSLPYLNHVSVPHTWFLDKMDSIPNDLENYVLKPLYSFAGQGVIVGPTSEEVTAARHSPNASEMILQERIDFHPTIETPYGPTKTELRVMYIWLDTLQPVTVLARMGRGKMMGVDYNRGLRWVGASAAFTSH